MIKAKRKEIPKNPVLAQGIGESKIKFLWRLFWFKIYAIVAVLTYVTMLTGYGLTVYAVFTEQPIKAVFGVVLALLSVHINKSNPSGTGG